MMTPVTKWTLGQNSISLSRVNDPKYPNRLAFLDDRTGRPSQFSCDLYNIDAAINYTHIFHRTIGTNLEREAAPNPACFIPKLSTKAHNAPEIDIALFGRVVATASSPLGEVKGLRWGVSDPSNKTDQSFEVEANDDVARAFILLAPDTNHEDIKPVLDKQGNPILDKNGKPKIGPTKDHYAMNSYAKDFRVVLERSADKSINKVILQWASLLDRNVMLDTNNWAVTLVSYSAVTSSGGLRLFGNTGHAMIVYEGIEDNRAFSKYFHITTEKKEGVPSGEAWIEDRDRIPPLKKLLKGPTFSRTKDKVEAMLVYKEHLQTLGVQPFSVFASIKNWFFYNTYSQERARHERTSLENCLSFCVSVSRKAGIELEEPKISKCSPNAYIEKLTSDFIFQENDIGTIQAIPSGNMERKEDPEAVAARALRSLAFLDTCR